MRFNGRDYSLLKPSNIFKMINWYTDNVHKDVRTNRFAKTMYKS